MAEKFVKKIVELDSVTSVDSQLDETIVYSDGDAATQKITLERLHRGENLKYAYELDSEEVGNSDTILMQSYDQSISYKGYVYNLQDRLKKTGFDLSFNCIDFETQTLADNTDTYANIIQGYARADDPKKGDSAWVYDDAGVNKIKLPFTGLYAVFFQVAFNTASSVGTRMFSIYNSTGFGIPLQITTASASSCNHILSGAQYFIGEADDLIRPVLKQTSGGSLSIVPADSQILIVRVSSLEI